MLRLGTHYLTLDPRPAQKYSPRTIRALRASVIDHSVLRQLSRTPIAKLTLRLGGDPGEHDHGEIILNTATRVKVIPPFTTHHFAPNVASYRSWVLLHEIGHHLAQVAEKNTAAFSVFAQQFKSGVCVTGYGLTSLSEYFAETFTATLRLPQLHHRDPAGVAEMQRILSTW
ncbi:hypothetical protein HLB42_07725 [Deinococcus sp. D7000]|nr:hypothetical protein HLB42_07725 [Deinococcus sp. D7000]